MEKVDRLGWAEGISLEFSEVRIGIRVSEPGHLPRVEQELLPGWKRGTDPKVHVLFSLFLGRPSRRKGTRSYDLLYNGVGQVIRTMDREEAFSALGSNVRQYAMAILDDRVAVRAGVAAWRGRAILLLGGPETGRSTLLKALVDLGAEYYSDEWALLDSRGAVSPVPIPLRLDRPIPASDLGYRADRPAVPVGLVASLRHQADGRSRLRLRNPGQAAMDLLAQSPTLHRAPELALEVLGRMAREVPSVAGSRGEAGPAARALLARLGGAS